MLIPTMERQRSVQKPGIVRKNPTVKAPRARNPLTSDCQETLVMLLIVAQGPPWMPFSCTF